MPPRGRPFVKGQSGNPGGRPKRAEFEKKARKAVDEKVVDAWIDEVEKRGEDWMRASELLAAYGYGKPPATVEVTGEDGGPIEHEVALTADERLVALRHVAALAAKRK
jgi:hypothetical protein